MLDSFVRLTANQFEAALCMLGRAIDACPESHWQCRLVGLTFDQAAFHTLFFTDLYLGPDVEAIRTQTFHQQHAGFFRDYEEFEDRPQSHHYDRPTTTAYLGHCREKAAAVLAAETEESLAARCGFECLDLSRAELHLYNLRHIQHHAAQLSLKLRMDTGDGVRWVGSGWHAEA